MRLRDRYDGGDDPFEGDRTIVWRSLPANALVTKLTFTVEPLTPPGTTAFVETLRFANGSAHGATIAQLPSNGIEIDFHGRRAPVAVAGLTLGSTSALTADLGGGVFLAVGPGGTIPASPPGPFDLTGGTLPGVAVARLRIANAPPAGDLNAATLQIATMPSNVTLRFGALAPFWSKTGQFGAATTTPDVTSALQRALDGATVENGYYVIPLAVHSDTLGRVAVTIDAEYLGRASLLPAGLREVVLPYDYGTTAKAAPNALHVTLPAGAAIVSPQTSLRVRGAFDASRIALGPTGATNEAQPLRCSPDETLAQAVTPAADLDVSAVDLLVGSEGPAARLALDLRKDFDGKPGQASLLAKPAPFDVGTSAGAPRRWITVTLAPGVRLAAGERVWLVLQAIEGAAFVGLDAKPDRTQPLQRSMDAGFSWRSAGADSPVLFRFRTVPDRFTMPLDFAAGAGAQQRRVRLSAYDALGKIDAVIDRPEIAATIQSAVAAVAPPRCANAELLRNGDFAQWSATGGALGDAVAITPGTAELSVVDTFFDRIPPHADIAVTGAECWTFSPDGGDLYVAASNKIVAVDAHTFAVRDLAPGGAAAVALAVEPRGRTLYVLRTGSLDAVDIASGATHEVSSAGPPDTVALALSPDGTRVYAGSPTPNAGGAIRAYDLETETVTRTFSGTASSLAVTANGALLVVADPASGLVVAFDTSSGAMMWSTSLPTGAPLVVAANPAGGVYALTQTTTTFAIVALDAYGRVTAQKQLPSFAGAGGSLAVKPQGDRVYAVAGRSALTRAGDRLVVARAEVAAIPVGTRSLTVWALTAGSVTPLDASDGEPAVAAMLTDGSISQTVAIAPGCDHVLTIDAGGTAANTSSNSTGAVHDLPPPQVTAEVLWIDASGKLVRDDTLALPPSRVVVTRRIRAVPPPGSVQAEVRIGVNGGSYVLRSVSFAATDELLHDDAWKPDSPAPLAERAAATGTAYRNAGAGDAAIAQRVPLVPSTPYELVLRASGFAGAANAGPYVEVRYVDASGAAVGSAQRIAVDTPSFALHPMSVTIPPGTAAADVRIVVPPGAQLTLEDVRLDARPAVDVPCTFIAQSPGELHVATAQVVYDVIAAAPPPPPAGGLAPPTPAGSLPGDPPAADSCDDRAAAPSAAPAALPAAARMPIHVSTAPAPPAAAPPAPAAAPEPAPPAVPALTEIDGIGAARERRLAHAGITDVRALAAATPDAVAQALAGSVVPPNLPATLIERANAALQPPA